MSSAGVAAAARREAISVRGVAPCADMAHSWQWNAERLVAGLMAHSWRRNAHRGDALRTFSRPAAWGRAERKLKHWS